MKNELKALYKKDPKLAKEVAKVLGFKIKAKTGIKELKADATKLYDTLNKLEDLRSDIEQALDETDLLKTATGKRFYRADDFLDKAISNFKVFNNMTKNLDLAGS